MSDKYVPTTDELYTMIADTEKELEVLKSFSVRIHHINYQVRLRSRRKLQEALLSFYRDEVRENARMMRRSQ